MFTPVQFTWFWVKKNLTEINHKVSVIAKRFRREFAAGFVGKCQFANNRRETAMQEGFSGSWAQESHLSLEHLNSVRGLNHRFLDLVGSRAGEFPALQVAPLSGTQRAAAADCPYALFDLRFEDDAYWKLRLEEAGHYRVADEAMPDGNTLLFVQLALFYAWHVASAAGLAAQLLLGMCHETAAAFRRITVNNLPALVATEAANLSARWSDCPAYWRALTSAAARADAAALRRVQLYGLQLAAAARLQ
jgi:hypothetical protein